MSDGHELYTTDRCKVKVHDDGDISIQCEGDDELLIGKQEIKMINGISDLATGHPVSK